MRYHFSMEIGDIIELMRRNPRGVRFVDAMRCAEHFFGKPRVHGSHCAFKMPWPGDPRINLQNKKGYVAAYQVRQLLAAIGRWEENNA